MLVANKTLYIHIFACFFYAIPVAKFKISRVVLTSNEKTTLNKTLINEIVTVKWLSSFHAQHQPIKYRGCFPYNIMPSNLCLFVTLIIAFFKNKI